MLNIKIIWFHHNNSLILPSLRYYQVLLIAVRSSLATSPRLSSLTFSRLSKPSQLFWEYCNRAFRDAGQFSAKYQGLYCPGNWSFRDSWSLWRFDRPARQATEPRAKREAMSQCSLSWSGGRFDIREEWAREYTVVSRVSPSYCSWPSIGSKCACALY